MNPRLSRGLTLNLKSYFLWKTMKKYLWMSSAVVLIGTWRVNTFDSGSYQPTEERDHLSLYNHTRTPSPLQCPFQWTVFVLPDSHRLQLTKHNRHCWYTGDLYHVWELRSSQRMCSEILHTRQHLQTMCDSQVGVSVKTGGGRCGRGAREINSKLVFLFSKKTYVLPLIWTVLAINVIYLKHISLVCEIIVIYQDTSEHCPWYHFRSAQ